MIEVFSQFNRELEVQFIDVDTALARMQSYATAMESKLEQEERGGSLVVNDKIKSSSFDFIAPL